MIILDTNVLSEILRPKPSSKVLEWIGSQPFALLFTTTITEAELFFMALTSGSVNSSGFRPHWRFAFHE
ncbi:MAG TPA: PIN domain-containing protein [Xanthobacteraceae bacterium]|jgi:predicted nucleic acid-binding protein